MISRCAGRCSQCLARTVPGLVADGLPEPARSVDLGGPKREAIHDSPETCPSPDCWGRELPQVEFLDLTVTRSTPAAQAGHASLPSHGFVPLD